ncbi:MAG TPA: hypothetical protein VIH37_07485 [Candidatus Limnocylindrales bacterium]
MSATFHRAAASLVIQEEGGIGWAIVPDGAPLPPGVQSYIQLQQDLEAIRRDCRPFIGP